MRGVAHVAHPLLMAPSGEGKTMQIKTAFVLLAAVSSAFVAGCGSSASTDQPTGATRASLHRAKSCGDLLGDFKADATFKLNKAVDRQIEAINKCISKYGDVQQCAYYGGYANFGSGGGGLATGAAEGDAKATPQAPPSNDRASSYSETNTQVKGVDEADIVKNDGKNLYVLHGRSFKVLNAWPANELKELTSTDVEGSPSEMFVADGKVVVYSQVNGADIFKAAGVTPKTQYQDYVYYPGGGGGVASSDARAPGYPGAPNPSTGEPYVPLTKITVMSLDANGNTQVTREVYFEGGYLDSRRVGPHVRTVLQGYAHGPKLLYSVYELYPQPQYDPNTGAQIGPQPDYPKTGSAMIAALNQLRSENLSRINASTLDMWLPYTFVKNGATVSAQTVACEDFYVPTVGTTESGITEVASLDLSDPTAVPKETAILGRADTVYGSADTLYLAAHAWIEPPLVWNDGGDVAVSGGGGTAEATPGSAPAPAPAPAQDPVPGTKSLRPLTTPTQTGGVYTYPTNETHIHKFEFKSDPKFPNYQASGSVPGNVKNQFSLDDKDGFLRIATTENRIYVDANGKYVSPEFTDPSNPQPITRPNSVNHVFTMAQNGPWLDIAGNVGDLAVNEQIYSVRFVGNRGYVVTFRQVDPLFVVDLAQPAAPTVLAALKIPGFSEYMHPLDENHLLTIGRDANAQGRTQGLSLQIFDVTNGASPVLQHKFAYTGAEYGSSEAEYDHKAFTYFADRNLLAFPYFSNSYTNGTYTTKSTLELFKVDLASGFAKVGAIDHTALVQNNPNGYCGGYFGPSVRRGVFMENFVYSISYGGVIVKDSNNLAAAGTQLALPSPQTNQGYGPACY
jgi:uncharacterized secreted protein with C-terminal beta-propeller domain